MGQRSDSTYPAFTFTDRDGTFHPLASTTRVISTAVDLTLDRDDSGCHVVVTGADKVVTLPATGAGWVYTITRGNGGLSSGTGLSISPNASDKINAAADDTDLVNTGATDAVGDSVTLVGDGAGGWYTTSVVGTWA